MAQRRRKRGGESERGRGGDKCNSPLWRACPALTGGWWWLIDKVVNMLKIRKSDNYNLASFILLKNSL